MKRFIAALAITALSLSACSTLPSSSDPQVLRSFSPQPEVDPAVGPTPGQEADLLVREFYSAAAIPSSDYSAARSFLSPEAAENWNPEESMRIVDLIELTSQNTQGSNQRTFTVRGSVIGSIASGGSYVPENSGYETTIRMEQVDGEWRITDLPDGVVFERTELRNHYQPLPVYFYRQTGSVLVTDRRWLFGSQTSLDAQLITLLLEGPSARIAPATTTVVPEEATFVGFEDGVYNFAGMQNMSADDRLRFAAELVRTLSHAGVQEPYSVTADGAPLVENLESMTTDDFAEYNPRVASNSVAPLYALNDGNILQVSGNAAEPLEGSLGDSGNIESADISANGVVAAVRREGDESQLIFGEVEGQPEEALQAETISRPTFENAGQAAWAVVEGDEIMRLVRSPQTGEVTTTRVDKSELDDIDGEISVIRLSNSGAQAAMIIGGEVYIGVVERQRSGDFRLTNVYNPASELGGTALSLDWQADGSLVVGTSTQETPVWRVEQDGSSVSTLPSGNITIPVVSIAASPSTLYITDYHAMLQLPVETESTYWREVPGMQGLRSAPIVAN
ncbi:MtrAB system accessory lipoprotein LpqB [Corynebacterium casei]|uniref:MtrAB system accessory lipoprotein LpqB n=1 Tax=Corynebacterium casei TaxID=160386 RepID=UPI0026499963|nr:MtrAB system accessory lipoprotein LpqB [Corynebacterium casei]MDN5705824.1 MtrAB system accessory lipoprotein LpqB [Corynebacterium casei]MDN6154725.1 MtrAB system accessory lipoprotein LpqB [Corynebacterium casei]